MTIVIDISSFFWGVGFAVVALMVLGFIVSLMG